MAYHGLWMTRSETLIYRVVPKCACSTLGQVLYHLDNGAFFDGDIHDATDGIHKWGLPDSRTRITAAVRNAEVPVFTCVRNPYTRILSAFFDKICTVQRNGRRYRENLVPMLMQRYGVTVTGDFDQIASFRRFLLFVRDTIQWRKPMDPDIHWSAVSGHVGTLIDNGGRYSHILRTEELAPGLDMLLDRIPAQHPVDPFNLPRFNEHDAAGPVRAHPVSAYFDDLSHHLMREIYGLDFALFGYDLDNPDQLDPIRPIDLDAVHLTLAAA